MRERLRGDARLGGRQAEARRRGGGAREHLGGALGLALRARRHVLGPAGEHVGDHHRADPHRVQGGEKRAHVTTQRVADHERRAPAQRVQRGERVGDVVDEAIRGGLGPGAAAMAPEIQRHHVPAGQARRYPVPPVAVRGDRVQEQDRRVARAAPLVEPQPEPVRLEAPGGPAAQLNS